MKLINWQASLNKHASSDVMLSLTLLGDNVHTDTMSPCRHTGAFIGGGTETRAHGVTSSHAGREDYISSNISSAVRSKVLRGAGGHHSSCNCVTTIF